MPSKTKNDGGLKDIRAFFGGSSAAPTKASSQPKTGGTSPAKPITISDNDDDSKQPRASSSRAPPPKRKSNKILLSDDSSDNEPALPTKNPVSSPITKKLASSPSKKKLHRISSSDEDEPIKPAKAASKPRVSAASSKPAPKRLRDDDSEEESDDISTDDDRHNKKRKNTKVIKAPAKRPRDVEIDELDAASEDDKKPKKKAKVAKPPASRKTPKAEEKDDIPKKKAFIPRPTGPPRLAGSKAIPEDADPNALAGLTFVFTGELSAFSREEIAEIAQRFGGRVTGGPSRVTSYVVLGANAGPKKLDIIAKHQLKTITEDEFLDLIATRKGKLDKKQLEKQQKENKKLEDDAKEIGKQEKIARAKGIDVSSQLWTTRYAPQAIKDIVGNKSNVEKLRKWLEDWPKSLAAGFKKPGENAMNTSRAVMITGPPGIGKTTSAHLAAGLTGYTPIELNASDARSKRLVESSTNINNTSLDGWRASSSNVNMSQVAPILRAHSRSMKKTTTVAGVAITDRTVLIMDEVDGMSAGDRGGVGALNTLIKKTRIPIICIANDRFAQKLKPLLGTCFNMSFSKPTVQMVRSRMMTVAHREKIQISGNVMDALIAGANSDIRQVLNMLSTWKLSHSTMDFSEGKRLAQDNEKHLIMTPFTMMDKLFGPYLFSSTSRASLSDKMDFYFQDHSFMPLFVQENYLKPEPSRLANTAGPEAVMKHLELMDKAASAISDGDLVDAAIHQGMQWGLMPLHAIHSTVKPAYHMYGKGMMGFGGKSAVAFPSWLGQNSKQGKLQRQLGDVQIRMRLKVSGDKNEIRQTYIPSLFPKIVRPLMEKNSGVVEVEEVINTMDEYYLSKDDWDTIVELGVGDMGMDKVTKLIPTSTKTMLTKKYNSSEHPIPFHKATEFGSKPAKKIGKGEAPDQEDVQLDDEDEGDEPDAAVDASDNDVSKDKLIKAKVAKGKKSASNDSKVQAKSRTKKGQ